MPEKKTRNQQKKMKVCLTRKLPDIIETRMKEFFDVTLNHDDKRMSQQELSAAMQTHEVIVPCVTDRFDHDMLKQARGTLKLIASFSAGLDHINIPAAHENDIKVTNTPDVLTEDTADMSMALICAITRRTYEGETFLRAGKWQGWSPSFMLGTRIWSKKLGIIGMGRIGMALARRARGFGLEVHYHNRNRVSDHIEQELHARYWSSLDHMLSNMDIISIHCPHTPATYHLLNKRRLALLQPSTFIINTARGEVIDERALIELLFQGGIAGAALDVFEQEPTINEQLLRLPNVVLLPHMASNTMEGRVQMGERVLINIKNYADGHVPPDLVIETQF